MALIRRRDESESTVARRPWDPFELMHELMRWDPFQELDRFGTIMRGGGSYVPAFDVKETKDAYVFTADLPGVEEKDLELSVTGNRLTISGKREEEKREESDRWYTYERSYGSFSRSFALPDGTDLDHVEAELKNGVLTVHVPKKPEVKPRKILLGMGKRSEHKA